MPDSSSQGAPAPGCLGGIKFALTLLAITMFFQFPLAFIGQHIYRLSHPQHRWQEISGIGGDWASFFFVLGIAPLLAVMGLCLLAVGLPAWKAEALSGTATTSIDNPDSSWFTGRRLFLLGIILLALAAVLAFLAAPDFERTALSGGPEVIPPVRWFRILTPR